MSDALDVGAEDVLTEGDIFVVYTQPNMAELNKVKEGLESKNWKVAEAKLAMIPQAIINLKGKDAETMLKLMDALEEHEDIQNVYSNFDIDEDVLKSLETAE
jgi:transcriptional/translational regulatory protein YebC/TACO1